MKKPELDALLASALAVTEEEEVAQRMVQEQAPQLTTPQQAAQQEVALKKLYQEILLKAFTTGREVVS